MAFDPSRPSDDALVGVLVDHFRVEPCVIVMWLQQFDSRAVTEGIAARFDPASINWNYHHVPYR